MRLAVRNCGSLLAEAVPVDLALCDSPVYESIVNCLCTTAGKVDVVVVSATYIGVTGDEEVLVRIVLEDGSYSVENFLGLLGEDILVEIEGNIVKHDSKELVRTLDLDCVVDFLDDLYRLVDVSYDRSREDRAEAVEIGPSKIQDETRGNGRHEYPEDGRDP